MQVDFVLREEDRHLPKELKEFDGYYQGRCLVVACEKAPHLVNKHFQCKLHSSVSMAPYFIYRAQLSSAHVNTIDIPKSQLVRIAGEKPKLGTYDIQYLIEELDVCNTPAEVIEQAKQLGSQGREITIKDIQACETLASYVIANCDIVRMQYLQPLMCYFFGAKKNEEQRQRLTAMSTALLREMVLELYEKPWDFIFKQRLKEKYGNVKPLTLEKFHVLCADRNITVPRHITLALEYYCLVRNVQAGDYKHTLFNWQTHLASVIPIAERREMEPAMRLWLEERAVVFPPPPPPAPQGRAEAASEFFTFSDMWSDAKHICQALLHYHKNSVHTSPELRCPLLVPAIPPRLKGAQVDAATNMLHNCVTVLEGYPGTGKTAVITWAVSHFKNVLLVTLTGSMAEALRTRNGDRDEVAHTIDHVIFAGLHGGQAARDWLAQFQVLIIDEFSNVSCNKLAQLLWRLPNLLRVLFVGDHNQIKSRKPGDMLGDLRNTEIFPHVELTEILRVDANLKDLYEVPKVMVEGNGGFNALNWSKNGPITLVEPPRIVDANDRSEWRAQSNNQDEKLLRSLLHQIWEIGGRYLMHHQIVVLQNATRNALNIHCHKLASEAGLIKNNAAPRVQIGMRTYCPGTKITFTKNCNKACMWKDPTKKAVWRGETVVNGECGVITSIRTLPNGRGHSITFVSDDRPSSGKSKSIICSNVIADAVSPLHIDFGYAITTTKVQGREYPYVVFWNNRGTLKRFWTRSHAYVALTRGKERVWCVSSRENIATLCSRPDQTRRTVLYDLLQQFAPQYRELFPHCMGAGELPKPQLVYKLLAKHLPCVPVMETADKDKKQKKKKNDDDNE